MEIITNLERVWEGSNNCPGCGSILGLKFILQSLENFKDVILVTSPGEIAPLGKSGLKVHFINSQDPVSTARGLSIARPEAKIIVYASHKYINFNGLPAGNENILCICYNNSLFVESGKLQIFEAAKTIGTKAYYTATANVSYYEDFIAKIKKTVQMQGFRFIDLLAPCPIIWNYDTSNTIEVGRMATESLLWPLYEIHNGISVTKIPPSSETVHRYMSMIKADMQDADMQALQEKSNRSWKMLKEGKLL